MVQINLVYQGNLRVEAVHQPSQKSLVTDAPVDNHGKGESFSPTDLVATSLASCMMTIMGIVAERHQIDLVGMKATVIKEMTDKPIRRIGKLTVDISSERSISEKDQKMLEKAAYTCPVHESLHPDIEKIIRFHWKS